MNPVSEPSLPMGRGQEVPVLLLSLPGQDRHPQSYAGQAILPLVPKMGHVHCYPGELRCGELSRSSSNIGNRRSGKYFLLLVSKAGEKRKPNPRIKHPDTLFCPCLWLSIICMVGLHIPVSPCSSTRGRLSQTNTYKMPSAKKKDCL